MAECTVHLGSRKLCTTCFNVAAARASRNGSPVSEYSVRHISWHAFYFRCRHRPCVVFLLATCQEYASRNDDKVVLTKLKIGMFVSFKTLGLLSMRHNDDNETSNWHRSNNYADVPAVAVHHITLHCTAGIYNESEPPGITQHDENDQQKTHLIAQILICGRCVCVNRGSVNRYIN